MLNAPHSPFEVLDGIWWISIAAFLVSLVVTPIVRLIAYRAKIVDRPDDLLKPHGRPVAYLGGLGMCLGLLVGLGGYLMVMDQGGVHWQSLRSDLGAFRVVAVLKNPIWNLSSIALGSIVITAVGLMDDIYEIRPRQKVLGQVVVACILLVGGIGYRMAIVGIGMLHITPPDWLLVPISAVACIAMVIAACNAMNLIDGLDGLCGGVTGIIAICFLALAVWLAMWARHAGADELRVALCLAMAGAVLGFLPYNVPPASIFMGDAGSMLLGFFVATMMAMFCAEGTARWFLASCVVFALPVLDTGLAVVRRVVSGRSIFAGDRSHLYDQLVDRGMTVKQVVGLFYLLSALAGVLGVSLAIFVRVRYSVPILAVLFVLVWIVFSSLGMIRPDVAKSASAKQSEVTQDQ